MAYHSFADPEVSKLACRVAVKRDAALRDGRDFGLRDPRHAPQASHITDLEHLSAMPHALAKSLSPDPKSENRTPKT